MTRHRPGARRLPVFGRRRAGFTLAEVLAAILFVSIGLFGYVSLQGRILHSNRKLQARQQPREAVQTVMDGWIYSLSANPASVSADPSIAIYGNESSLATLTRVRVNVRWDDENGTQNFAVETVVGKGDADW